MRIYTHTLTHTLTHMPLHTKNRTNGKRQFRFVCLKPKMEVANFPSYAANGNGKRKLVFLGKQT